MFRNIFLAVSAFVFLIILAFVSWYGLIFTLEFLYSINWLSILFTTSIILIILYAIYLIYDYLVLDNPISAIILWLKFKSFIANITWDKLFRWFKITIIIIISLLVIIGSYSIYLKINKLITDIQLSQYYKAMYLKDHQKLEDIERAFDEMSVDYASAMNMIKHKFYVGASGNP